MFSDLSRDSERGEHWERGVGGVTGDVVRGEGVRGGVGEGAEGGTVSD